MTNDMKMIARRIFITDEFNCLRRRTTEVSHGQWRHSLTCSQRKFVLYKLISQGGGQM